MEQGKVVMICERMTGKEIPLSALELLTVGRAPADELGLPLAFFVLGSGVDDAAGGLIAAGADIVCSAKDVSLDEFQPQLYAAVLAQACGALAPSLVLFSHGDVGRDVAPRLAARLRAQAVTDCTGVRADAGAQKFFFTKPVYGGQALAVWEMEGSGPHVSTIRPRAAKPAASDASRQGRVVTIDAGAAAARPEMGLVETVKEEIKGVKLEEAEVVVAGGGGIGGAEGFELLSRLAGSSGRRSASAGCLATRAGCRKAWRSGRRAGRSAPSSI